jgi:hypothetical protein
MSKIIRLTESQFTTIIKKVIKEQYSSSCVIPPDWLSNYTIDGKYGNNSCSSWRWGDTTTIGALIFLDIRFKDQKLYLSMDLDTDEEIIEEITKIFRMKQATIKEGNYYWFYDFQALPVPNSNQPLPPKNGDLNQILDKLQGKIPWIKDLKDYGESTSDVKYKGNEQNTTKGVSIITPNIVLDNQTFEGVTKKYTADITLYNGNTSDITITKDMFGLENGWSVPDRTIIPSGKEKNIPITLTLDPKNNEYYAKQSQRTYFNFMNRYKSIVLNSNLSVGDKLDDFSVTIKFTSVKILDNTQQQNVSSSGTQQQNVTTTNQTTFYNFNFDNIYNYLKIGDKYYVQKKGQGKDPKDPKQYFFVDPIQNKLAYDSIKSKVRF